MYETGHGVAQDRQQAIYWYRKSAAQNSDPDARQFAEQGLKRLQ
jgi:TPR repeat protein